MAQHDFNIANQVPANLRADLNNALSAIATNSSGASAPSTTFANQWWYDTTNDLLKIRNEADTAWITVGELDQTSGVWKPYVNGKQIADFLDEDDMASDSATAVPSQQSVKAYVDAEVAAIPSPSSMTLLATVTTTSGYTITQSGLDFSGYTKLEIYYDDVSVSVPAVTSYLNTKFGSGSYFQVTTNIGASAGNTLNGVTTVHLNNGTYASVTAENDDPIAVSHAGSFGNVSAETSISWDWAASQTFDAGQILVYGVK